MVRKPVIKQCLRNATQNKAEQDPIFARDEAALCITCPNGKLVNKSIKYNGFFKEPRKVLIKQLTRKKSVNSYKLEDKCNKYEWL